MYARFGHFMFNSARLNENKNDSDNFQRIDYIPLSAETAELISPASPQTTFLSSDVPQNAPYKEVAG